MEFGDKGMGGKNPHQELLTCFLFFWEVLSMSQAQESKGKSCQLTLSDLELAVEMPVS